MQLFQPYGKNVIPLIESFPAFLTDFSLSTMR
jgi:hypothetical protein